MWIRVYNLPFKGRLNTNIDEAIGNKIGDFIKMDSSGLMRIDKSVRIRVKFDVRKPLMKRVKIKRRGGVEEIFDVKYERPPLFYYLGKIGHGLKDHDLCHGQEDPHLFYRGRIKVSPWKHNRDD